MGKITINNETIKVHFDVEDIIFDHIYILVNDKYERITLGKIIADIARRKIKDKTKYDQDFDVEIISGKGKVTVEFRR